MRTPALEEAEVTKKQISNLPLLVNAERATSPTQINIKTRLTVDFSWGIPPPGSAGASPSHCRPGWHPMMGKATCSWEGEAGMVKSW